MSYDMTDGGVAAYHRLQLEGREKLSVSGVEDAGGVWPPEGAVPPGAVLPACPPQPVRQASKSAAVKPKEMICFILYAPFCVRASILPRRTLARNPSKGTQDRPACFFTYI